MKKIATLLTAAVTSGFTAAATTTTAPTDSVSMTLQQCIEAALTQSPTVKIADMEIKRVDYSRKETLASLLPAVNFGGNYTRMLAKQTMYLNMGAFGGGSTDGTTTSETTSKKDSGIKMGLDNSYQVGFSAQAPLIAPQLWQSLKLNDGQIALTAEQARQSRLQLVSSIKSAYYALMLAHDSRRVINESYRMAALTHDIYTKNQTVGAASEFDVLRTSVAMKNIEPEMAQAEIAVNRARLQLYILMGLDTAAPIRFTGTLADFEKTMYDDAMRLGTDYSNNSQLRLNALQTATLQQAVKVQQAAWYPTLAMTGTMNWTSSSNGSPLKNFRWNPYSTIGLTLSLPLYDGNARLNRVRSARLQVTQAQLQRENIENTVAMQIDLARQNMLLNVKQIASATQSVEQAQKAHSIMQQSFDIGAASYLDLRDAELALTRSRLAYYQSIYNYLTASAELELLLGNAVTPEN